MNEVAAEPAAEVIVAMPLPCGCVVSQKYVALGVVRGEEEAKMVIQFGADRLKLWAEQRAFSAHRCPPKVTVFKDSSGSTVTRPADWRAP